MRGLKPCPHRYCNPFGCRFADTAHGPIVMRQGDRRDAHNFNLLAMLRGKLSTRGKLAIYSGVYSKDH